MAKQRTVTIGTTKHVVLYSDSEEEFAEKWLDDLRKTLKPNGEAIRHPDGKMEWIEDVADVDTSKQGSEQYVWDRSGNKVRCTRFFCRTTEISTHYSVVERKRIRSVYRKFEEV